MFRFLFKPNIEKLVKKLIKALEHTNGHTRLDAVRALGKIKDARAVEPLIAALNDKEDYVRWNAAEALGEMRDARAIEPLIAALSDKNALVRKDAEKSLSKFENQEAIPAAVKKKLLIVSLNNKDSHIRKEAVETLAKIGDAQDIKPLKPLLLDSQSDVRKASAEALDSLSWTPSSNDDNDDKAYYLIAKCDWDKCIKLGVSVVQPLIHVFGRVWWAEDVTETKKQDFLNQVVSIIREIGPQACKSIVDSMNPTIQTGLDTELGTWSDDAAYVLGRVGDTAIPPLVSALSKTMWAHLALGLIGTEEAIDILLKELHSPNWRRVEAAAQGLGASKDERALPELRAVYNALPTTMPIGEVSIACEDAIKKIEKSMADEIGPEVCKHDGCTHLRIKYSVMCSQHHAKDRFNKARQLGTLINEGYRRKDSNLNNTQLLDLAREFYSKDASFQELWNEVKRHPPTEKDIPWLSLWRTL